MTGRPMWRWLGLLVAAGILSQATVHLVRPATTYKLLALDAGGVTIGLVTGVYALLPLVMAMQIGARAQRNVSLRALLVSGSALVVLGVACVAGFNNIWSIALGSAVLGLGQLIFTVAGQAVVARYASDAQMDAAFGWFTAGFSGGQLIGPLLGGFIMGGPHALGGNESLDYINLAIWVGGSLSLLSISFLQFSRGAFRGWDSPGMEKDKPEISDVAPSEGAPTEPNDATVRSIFRIPAIPSHLLASIAMISILDILSAFLPLLGEEAGLSPATVGILLAVRAAASIISRATLPVMRIIWSRAILVLLALWISGISLALVPLVDDSVVWMAALLGLAGFFLGMGQPLTMSLVTQAVPMSWRASALAVRLMGNRVGQVVVPVAAGALAAPLGSAGAIWAGCLLLLASGTDKTLVYLRRPRSSNED